MKLAITRTCLAFLVGACTVADESNCPNRYTPDNFTCAWYFCEKHPDDIRCRDGGVWMDGGADATDGSSVNDSAIDGSPPDAMSFDCDNTEDCASPLPYCGPAKKCVACLQSDHCPATAPVCSGKACVGCSAPSDCVGRTDALACDTTNGHCVQCTSSEDDACKAQSKVCASDGTSCVECNVNTECPSEKPHCNAQHVCEPCSENNDCAGRTNGSASLSVCSAVGTCAECTGTDYQACGTNNLGKQFVCKSRENVCSPQTEKGLGLCDPCDSDAACAQGQRCVMQRFKSKDVGYFCAWEQGAQGAPADCALARPYVQTQVDAVSIDGHKADICVLRTTTCPAMQQFSTAQGACGANTSSDQACGVPNADDGLCRAFSAMSNRCTVPCSSSDDCVSGHACNTSVTARYCDLQTGTCYGNQDCPDGQTCNIASRTCQ